MAPTDGGVGRPAPSARGSRIPPNSGQAPPEFWRIRLQADTVELTKRRFISTFVIRLSSESTCCLSPASPKRSLTSHNLIVPNLLRPRHVGSADEHGGHPENSSDGCVSECPSGRIIAKQDQIRTSIKKILPAAPESICPLWPWSVRRGRPPA